MLCLHFRFRLFMSMKMREYMPAHLFTLSSSLVVTTPRNRFVMVWDVHFCSLREIHYLVILCYWLSLLSVSYLPAPVSLDLEVCSNSTWYYRTTSTLHQNKATLRVSAIYYDPVHLFLWVLVTMNNNVMIMRTHGQVRVRARARACAYDL